MSFSSASNRKRQPAGRPTGGQFATEVKAGAGVSLQPAETTGTGKKDLAWQENLVDSDGNPLTPEQFQEHIEDLYGYLQAQSSRSVWRSTFGHTWTGEDAAQDAVVEMLDRARRNGNIAAVNHGYARGYMGGLVTRAIQARREGRDPQEHLKVNSANMKAFDIFSKRVDEIESELGRSLGTSERDAIATQVRQEWHDPRHRPTIGFHRPMYADSTDAEGFNQATGATGSAEQDYFDSLAGDDQGEDTRRVLEAPRGGAGVRKHGWNALCETRGIPKAPQGVLSNRQVSYCRQNVGTEASEVLSVLAEWEGGGDNERIESLFRPFGAVTGTHREQVADLMRDMPDEAGRFFSLALAGATKRNFQ